MKAIKVAIDSGPLTSGHAVRGIGVMVSELIQALNEKTKKLKNLRIDAFDFSTNQRLLITNHYDVIHYPYFFPYALTLPPQKYGKRVVVTIQDLILLVYPKHYPAGVRGRISFIKQKQRLKNVDAVITISETSKKDIVRFLGIPPEKIHVIYLAPKSIFKDLKTKGLMNERTIKILEDVKKKFYLPQEFALYVGDINYNKNVPGLIKACKLANTPLVIVGKHALEIEENLRNLKSVKGPRDWVRFLFNMPHPEVAHFSQLVDEFRNTKNIIRTGFVSEEELVALYNLASVYVQPSFYEGFGLPVLEAMACGCPVIVAKTNSLIEVTNGVALVADPNNPLDLADKIVEVIKDTKVKQRLIREGFKNVMKFSWKKTAKQMFEIYKKVSND